jgi:hypothetical protein
MQPRRLLPLFALFAVLATLAAPARAQSVTLTEAGIKRDQPYHSDPTARLWISRGDCLADDLFYFPATLSNYAGYSLDVWVGNGTDCKEDTQRSSTSALCWRVYTGVPTSQVTTIPIRVRDIIAGRAPDGGVATAANCDPTSSATSPIQLTLYFMLISGTSTAGTTVAQWSTKYDLVGPSPPTGVGVGVGGTMLKVSWNANADTDVSGYTFFCDPPPGVIPSGVTYFEAGPGAGGAPGSGGAAGAPAAGGAAPDVDAATDADTDASDAAGPTGAGGSTLDAATDSSSTAGAAGAAGSTAGNSCTMSLALTAGQVPSADALARNQCGTVGKADTSFRIVGLTDYQQYAVAVAATDAVGNVGPLSLVACGTPQPIVGFLEAYRTAGGTAGGDSCEMGWPAGRSHSRWIVLLAGAAVMALILRARRRR